MRAEKPLLGFGWMGWVLLAVAGALAVFVFSNDPDLRLLHLVEVAFGSEAEDWVNRAVLGSHRFNSTPQYGPLPFFDLWGLSVVLLGLQIHPRRSNPWWVASLALLAIVTPIAWLYLEQSAEFSRLTRNWPFGNRASYSFLMLSAVLTFALTLATKSVKILAGMVAITVAYVIAIQMCNIHSYISVALGTRGRTFATEWVCWLWNPLLFAVLLSWAIPARIRYNRWWLCFKCGYNMRDIENTTCPECGTVNERMPAPVTPSKP